MDDEERAGGEAGGGAGEKGAVDRQNRTDYIREKQLRLRDWGNRVWVDIGGEARPIEWKEIAVKSGTN
jgi:hypothetical protein